MSDDSAALSESDLYSRTGSNRFGPQERLRHLGVKALSSTDLLAP